jgi:hypothetical protein
MPLVLVQVAAAHVTDLKIIPDIDESSIEVTVSGTNTSAGLPVSISVLLQGNGTKVSMHVSLPEIMSLHNTMGQDTPLLLRFSMVGVIQWPRVMSQNRTHPVHSRH